MRPLFTFLLVVLGINLTIAQTAKDITVPMTATLNTGPTSITLTWPNPGAANILILRRTKGQPGNSWSQLINVTNSNLTSVTDNGVANGLIYEYVIQRAINNFNAFGYVHVAVNANPVNNRGKILVFVDSTSAAGASVELEQLYNDMRGDGWWPIPFLVGPSATVPSVKAQIVAAYNADVQNTKSVLLIGNVPVPYSGNAAWDGHVPDHEGAWPCDSYYGDVNGVWTDASVDNSVPNRVANKNVPGDGKFDQNFNPSAIELQVGRIDFRRIDAAAFGAPNQVALLKRYLQKDHRWRTGEYTVDNKAIIDDNFGYFGGEAFAANGWRNAYPLVGEANIVEADFFLDTDPQTYLMGFGCGGGNYNGAGGVGSSANFATDSVNVVFANLFGSYFGDWDFETNPFMVSALASRGGILTCSWAGRPHHFYHALASGETIGYVMWETMNAQFNNGYYGSFGESGAHVALLGDPTLRANVVKPAKNLVITAPTCKSVVLDWTASADAVTGYHVYRALNPNGPYTRLTTSPINAVSYTDNNPPLDTLYYQVRAIKNVTNPGGGTYANNATGVLGSINFVGAGGPTVTATGGSLNCNITSLNLGANATPGPVSNWNWSGPNNYSSSLQNPTVTAPGVYTVTATDAIGCSGTASATVVGDFDVPTILVNVSNAINCVQSSATISVSSAGFSGCTIFGPNGLQVQGFEAVVTQAGSYQITAVSASNGCIGTVPAIVNLDTAPPSSSASNDGPITCVNPSATLTGSSSTPNATYSWNGPCLTNNIAECGGIYTVTVTNPANGCTSSASTIVEVNTTPPTVSAQDATITCNTPDAPLVASWSPATATAQWSGPCLNPGNPNTASCPGQYTVVVTRPDNGCTASDVAIVTENTDVPIINLPPVPPLTCSAPCFVFTAPNLPGLEIYIGGVLVPPGTTFDICAAGTYTATIKSLLNGCTRDVSLVVTENTTPPTVDAGPDAVVSCGAPSTQLSGSGSGALLWTGPDGFVSAAANPVVSQTGVYVLTATNSANGCTASDQAVVSSDGSLPTVNASASGELNCTNQSVLLQSGNNNPNATFAWTGPNGFSSNLPNPSVSVPGSYTVVVTIGVCTATDGVLVTQAPPFVVEPSVTLLPCDVVAEVCLEVSGGTPPYLYQWSNGNNQPCAQVGSSGAIGVTVTDAGGCSFSSSQNIVIPPPLSVTISGVLNCTGLDNVCATVSGGTEPYTYQWSNNSSNANCASFPNGGLVSLTVTDAAGCTQTATTTISQTPSLALTLTVTDASAVNAQDGAVNLTVGGGSGIFAYNWSNGATTEDLNNVGPGNYSVIVVDVASGCTITGTAVVNVSVGTQEAEWLSQFQLSPNPTNGISLLNLQLHQPTGFLVEVHTMTGQLIWSSTAQFTNQLTMPIDLSASPTGLYTVSVKLSDRVFVRKLSVIRD
ncbi:MAG: T9SS type A sorting domain-containing protein [Chitinophagales bacterium]|nr:T9SS type A sorting domain-containing protein [Chitinophagales bacterium]